MQVNHDKLRIPWNNIGHMTIIVTQASINDDSVINVLRTAISAMKIISFRLFFKEIQFLPSDLMKCRISERGKILNSQTTVLMKIFNTVEEKILKRVICFLRYGYSCNSVDGIRIIYG